MADFNFYLNRQGVRGPQGPQGEQGFSPDITVETDTLSEYILRITNEGGYFLTTNLREHKEDRGGTYIRYDRDTGVMYAGDADVATVNSLGVIRIAQDGDFAGRAEDAAVTPAQIQDYLDENYVDVHNEQNIEGAKRFQTSVYAKQLMTPTITSDSGAIINFDLDTKASTFTSDVSFTKTPTVGALGELALKSQVDAIEPVATEAKDIANAAQIAVQKLDSEVVHNTGNETVAGVKTFSDRTAFKSPINITPDINGYIIDSKWMIGSANTILSHSGSAYIAFGRSGLTVTAPDASTFAGKVLTVNSVEAGDNITVEKTDTGIKISGQAGGGSGDVSAAGDNNFTGQNTFNGVTLFNNDVRATNNIETTQELYARSYISTDKGLIVDIAEGDYGGIRFTTGVTSLYNVVELDMQKNSVTGETNKVLSIGLDPTLEGYTTVLRGPVLKTDAGSDLQDYNGNKYLTEATGASAAQLDALNTVVTGLQTALNNAIDRIAALEALIDGGNASDTYPADPQKIDANPGIDSAINTGEINNSVDITVEDN